MTQPLSAGSQHEARALWYVKPGVVELRAHALPPPKLDQVQVRTHFSAISRGTERLVLAGDIPDGERERMRAPLQEGTFPFPVKYGYCATGIVELGPSDLIGRRVFCLHPHQDAFNAPSAMAVPVPGEVPLKRATLAANMETALNALWDSAAGPADRIVVVGAGVVGLLVSYLAARLPGADVLVIDALPARRSVVEQLGARFVGADDIAAAPADQPAADVVFHCSATAPGLSTALALAGTEAAVVELSWYGARSVPIPLGAAFHSQRLRLISSQVGQVAPSRRPRWSHRRRIEAALALLADPSLDPLVAEEIAFDDAPHQLPALLNGPAACLAPVLRYLPKSVPE